MLHGFGYPDKIAVDLGLEADMAVSTKVYVRCRKCDQCLQHRSNLWAARACDEISMSLRTWFGTLTFRPEDHTRFLALARRRIRIRQCADFDEMSATEQFRELVKEANVPVTKFFKRIRQYAGTLRYLAVVEAHKSGLPHYHLLLHELGEPLTKRTLEAQWRSGFSHWRLVNDADPQAAFYCAKYLSKSLLARVRSSIRYGRPRVSAKLVSLMGEQSGNGTLAISTNPPV